ncbi:MAG TPA: PadR family transcriptional regulator [Pseudonocardiaceae bacterium]
MRDHFNNNYSRWQGTQRHRGEFPEEGFGGRFDPRIGPHGGPHHGGRGRMHGGLPPVGDMPPAPGGFPGFPGFPGRAGFPGGPGFPGGFGGRHGHRGGGRGRARRGNVRAAVLALLAERPMYGYEMIQEIAQRSEGVWRLSPGSVYPTLQLLADEGLVTSEESDSGKRLYSLTDAGREEAGRQDSTPPWQRLADDVDPNEIGLREAAGLLFTAVAQVSQAANSAQKAQATKAITEARQRLYLILAEAAGSGEAVTNSVDDTITDDVDDDEED